VIDVKLFKDIIRRNKGAFQNGVAFPDFGYNCPLGKIYPELPDASEAAHWVTYHPVNRPVTVVNSHLFRKRLWIISSSHIRSLGTQMQRN
jgi:hypothetical protein